MVTVAIVVVVVFLVVVLIIVVASVVVVVIVVIVGRGLFSADIVVLFRESSQTWIIKLLFYAIDD